MTSVKTTKIVYKDLNRSVGEDSNSPLVTNLEVIHKELENLFTTVIGEVDFEPTLGSSLINRLFDPRDDQTVWALEHDLFLAVNFWMSQRIKVNQENIHVLYPDDERGFDLNLSYEIVGLGVSVESTIQLRK